MQTTRIMRGPSPWRVKSLPSSDPASSPTGGMGEVYRALDTKLNRPVAVKVLSDDLADATARRRPPVYSVEAVVV